MHTILIVVIPADIEKEVGYMTIDSGDLSAMQGLVGGLVQALDLNAQKATMWVNENGKNERLPMNQRGTMALWMSDPVWRFQDFVSGDVFLTGPANEEGESTPVPDELFQLFFRTAEYRVEIQTKKDGDAWLSHDETFEEYWDAAHSVLDLASRWKAVTDLRVVPA